MGNFIRIPGIFGQSSGWGAVLIEVDEGKFNELKGAVAKYPAVIPLNCYLSHTGPTSLDNVLLTTNYPADFDLLSIDVDGNEFHIWHSLANYHPKVVVV